MYKRHFLFLLTALVFFKAGACILHNDSLEKRKSSEKFVDLLRVRYAGSHLNVHVFELESASATVQELEKAGPSKIWDLEEKQNLIYAGLKLADEKENWFYKNLQTTLKISGYVDTVNSLFIDRINLVLLDVRIDSVNLYILNKRKSAQSIRTKLYVTWFLNDYFEDTTDIVRTSGFSAEYSAEGTRALEYLQNSPEAAEDIVLDAFDKTFTNLRQNTLFAERLKFIDNYTIPEPLLPLTPPISTFTDKEDVVEACVVVKTGSSNGSGFAITSDGYLITSYGAVEKAIIKKKDSVMVITANGREFGAKIVRINKYRNAALLKVNAHFAKALKLPAEKNYKNMTTAYTIGTSKFVELGQSMSSGIISSERKTNNNYFLQLNLSINSGNSGGPLFSGLGELYGMTVFKLTGFNTEGVSFAIPAFLLENYLQIKLSR